MAKNLSPKLTPRLALALGALLTAPAANAYELRQIPDEYETSGGNGPALSNAGIAATDSHSAVRVNPGLLALDRTYSVSAGYHWPSAGREFFKAGIVDSKTSSIAAGVSYTGYTEEYVYNSEAGAADDADTLIDSPVIRRGFVGFAQNFKTVAIGAGATYVEANPVQSSEAFAREETRVKGVGLNMGVAGAAGQNLRYGLSAENLTNKKIRDYAPKTYRGGISYAVSKSLVASLDYRQRDRVVEFEAVGADPLSDEEAEQSKMDRPEQLVIGSFVARLAEYFQLLGSYGQSTTDDRRTFGGGAALSGDKFTLSYLMSRPYMARAESHQAVTLSVQVSM